MAGFNDGPSPQRAISDEFRELCNLPARDIRQHLMKFSHEMSDKRAASEQPPARQQGRRPEYPRRAIDVYGEASVRFPGQDESLWRGYEELSMQQSRGERPKSSMAKLQGRDMSYNVPLDFEETRGLKYFWSLRKQEDEGRSLYEMKHQQLMQAYLGRALQKEVMGRIERKTWGSKRARKKQSKGKERTTPEPAGCEGGSKSAEGKRAPKKTRSRRSRQQESSSNDGYALSEASRVPSEGKKLGEERESKGRKQPRPPDLSGSSMQGYYANKDQLELSDLLSLSPSYQLDRRVPESLHPSTTPTSRKRIVLSIKPNHAPSFSSDVATTPTILEEGSSHRQQGEAKKKVLKRLKPKLLSNLDRRTSLVSEARKHVPKTYGCPECFSSLGGTCVRHLAVHWEGSLRQERSQLLQQQQQQQHKEEGLTVKVYTAADTRRRGLELKLHVDPQETIRSLKQRVASAEGTPVDYQRFLYRGKYLDDDMLTAETLGLSNSGVLFVVLKPMKHNQSRGAACELCSQSLGGVCSMHISQHFAGQRPVSANAWLGPQASSSLGHRGGGGGGGGGGLAFSSESLLLSQQLLKEQNQQFLSLIEDALETSGESADLSLSLESRMQQWFSESLSREMKASLTAKEEERSLFRHRGEEFARGERVSILFEDGKWYEGLLDSYSSRSSKIRVKFSNPSIGTVHVQLDQVQMRKAGRKEEEKGRQEEEEKGRREEEEGEETGNTEGGGWKNEEEKEGEDETEDGERNEEENKE